jgi:hypothetical protein|nr:MAG TPA: hypothetical protein [Caudoviricetes sp.]
MTIFLYDQVSHVLTLNEPEILLITEFSALMDNKRNICKEDPKGIKKLRAFKEFTYMYLMIDWQSHYSQFSEAERNEAAKQDSGITEEEFNDPTFRTACRKYREIQESARDIKLVRAAQNKVDELIDYFNEGSDLQERDPITGKPIFKAKDVIGEMASISKVLDELDALEARIKKKQKAASGLRAGATEGYTPKIKK